MIKVKSVFLSDIHLANPNCQVDRLNSFLDQIIPEQIFLLGDIVDLWKLSGRKGRWYTKHEQLLKRLLDYANNGVSVVYIPGNHDPFFRTFEGKSLGAVSVHEEFIHTLVSGEKILLMHGDKFDQELYIGDFWHYIGEFFYEAIVTSNRWLNVIRKYIGLPYWSLSVALKMQSKKARSYIEAFEHKAVNYAKSKGLNGVICGHIHQSKLTMIDDLIYANDGDWVESCSALVEHLDGKLQLVTTDASTFAASSLNPVKI